MAFSVIPAFRDALLEASLLRLSSRAGDHHVSEDIGDEIAARQIVMRLCGTIGANLPDWQDPGSVFLPTIMRQIVAQIDANLAVPLPLESLSSRVGLSPGHFARKFKLSTGFSLGRFVNTRRICRSFALLADEAAPLAGIALALGFSSQSHFTRLFSSQTGIAPQQYRRQQARMAD